MNDFPAIYEIWAETNNDNAVTLSFTRSTVCSDKKVNFEDVLKNVTERCNPLHCISMCQNVDEIESCCECVAYMFGPFSREKSTDRVTYFKCCKAVNDQKRMTFHVFLIFLVLFLFLFFSVL